MAYTPKKEQQLSTNMHKYNETDVRPAARTSRTANSDLVSLKGMEEVIKSNRIYNKESRGRRFTKIDRFNMIDPYGKLTGCKEYIFFTKPDLHIYTPGKNSVLNPILAKDPFFVDLHERYPHVIHQLQRSIGARGKGDCARTPFMKLLTNTVRSSLELPGISANEMDGPVNFHGTSMSYRKDGIQSDENITFSLEFEDSKFLEVYMLVKAYEEYNRYKMKGLIYPPNIKFDKQGRVVFSGDGGSTASELKDDLVGEIIHNYGYYIKYKILHDVMGIYRIVVEDDYETIVYWSYVCGAYFSSVPRDAFNDIKAGEINFSVDFKAFKCFEMHPLILANFNRVVRESYDNLDDTTCYERLYPFNDERDEVDTEWASTPYIYKKKYDDNSNKNIPNAMKYQYKLAWYNMLVDE